MNNLIISFRVAFEDKAIGHDCGTADRKVIKSQAILVPISLNSKYQVKLSKELLEIRLSPKVLSEKQRKVSKIIFQPIFTQAAISFETKSINGTKPVVSDFPSQTVKNLKAKFSINKSRKRQVVRCRKINNHVDCVTNL